MEKSSATVEQAGDLFLISYTDTILQLGKGQETHSTPRNPTNKRFCVSWAKGQETRILQWPSSLSSGSQSLPKTEAKAENLRNKQLSPLLPSWESYTE